MATDRIVSITGSTIHQFPQKTIHKFPAKEFMEWMADPILKDIIKDPCVLEVNPHVILEKSTLARHLKTRHKHPVTNERLGASANIIKLLGLKMLINLMELVGDEIWLHLPMLTPVEFNAQMNLIQNINVPFTNHHLTLSEDGFYLDAVDTISSCNTIMTIHIDPKVHTIENRVFTCTQFQMERPVTFRNCTLTSCMFDNGMSFFIDCDIISPNYIARDAIFSALSDHNPVEKRVREMIKLPYSKVPIEYEKMDFEQIMKTIKPKVTPWPEDLADTYESRMVRTYCEAMSYNSTEMFGTPLDHPYLSPNCISFTRVGKEFVGEKNVEIYVSPSIVCFSTISNVGISMKNCIFIGCMFDNCEFKNMDSSLRFYGCSFHDVSLASKLPIMGFRTQEQFGTITRMRGNYGDFIVRDGEDPCYVPPYARFDHEDDWGSFRPSKQLQRKMRAASSMIILPKPKPHSVGISS